MNHIDDSTLNEYLDGRLGDLERGQVTGHIAGCAPCQARLEALSGVFQSLDTLTEVQLERDLSAQIVSRIAAESRPWQAPRWLRVALLAQIVTAGALLATQLSAAQALAGGAGAALSEALATVTASLALNQFQRPLLEWAANLGSLLRASGPGIALSTAQWLPIIALVLLLWLVGNGLLLRIKPNGAP